MTVTGESELQTESAKIVASLQEMEGARQAQPQLVAVQRHSFDLLKELCEVHRRHSDLSRNISQSPTPTHVGRQPQLPPTPQLRPPKPPAGGMRCRRAAPRPPYQRQQQGLALKRVG